MQPVIKLQVNKVEIDMLHGRAASATKLLDFQSKSPPPLLVGDGIQTSKEPRREYIIDDTDLVGAVRTCWL